jgi:hypothetical protein
MSDLYDTDTVLWAERQADLLRRVAAGERVNDQVDWKNVVEEIEDVARRDRDRVFGQLVTLCQHLLKWRFQPEMRSGSWRGSVVGARDRIAKLLRDSPSLAAYPASVLAEAYPPGRRKAEAETGLSDLPASCPWSIEQVLDHAFWPGED